MFRSSKAAYPVLTAIVALVLALPVTTLGTGGDTRSASSYRLKSAVMAAAGTSSGSDNYSSNATMGQPTPIGLGHAPGTALHAGFWYMPWVLASVLGGENEALANGMFQNYPNPFAGSTTIAYSIAREGHVEVAVFDVRGRKIRSLVNGAVAPGSYLATWDGRDRNGSRVAPGMYFYRLSAGDYRAVRKMLLLK